MDSIVRYCLESRGYSGWTNISSYEKLKQYWTDEKPIPTEETLLSWIEADRPMLENANAEIEAKFTNDRIKQNEGIRLYDNDGLLFDMLMYLYAESQANAAAAGRTHGALPDSIRAFMAKVANYRENLKVSP